MTSYEFLAAVVAAAAVAVSLLVLAKDVLAQRRLAETTCHELLNDALLHLDAALRIEPLPDPVARATFDSKVRQAEQVAPRNRRLRLYKGYLAEVKGNSTLAREYFRDAASASWGSRREVSIAYLHLARMTVDRNERVVYLNQASRDRAIAASVLQEYARMWAKRRPYKKYDSDSAVDFTHPRDAIDEAIRLEPKRSDLHSTRAWIYEDIHNHYSDSKEPQLASEAAREASESWRKAIEQSTSAEASYYGSEYGWNVAVHEGDRDTGVLILTDLTTHVPPGASAVFRRLAALYADWANETGPEEYAARQQRAREALRWVSRVLEANPAEFADWKDHYELRQEMDSILAEGHPNS